MKKTTAHLKFPSQFSKFINNVETVEFEGESIIDFVNCIDARYDNVKERLIDTDGQLKPYLNLFIGKKNIRSIDGINSIIPQEACISLLLSRAGG